VFFFLLGILLAKLDFCRELQLRMSLVALPAQVSIDYVFKAMLFLQLQLVKFLGDTKLAIK
jgi:hypothetical protein